MQLALAQGSSRIGWQLSESQTRWKGRGALDFLKNAASPLRSPVREGKGRDGKGAFEWPQSPSSAQGHAPQKDAERLARVLSTVDANDLRMRRERFNRLYHEAIMLMHPRKGISFTGMLLLLARTKLVTRPRRSTSRTDRAEGDHRADRPSRAARIGCAVCCR